MTSLTMCFKGYLQDVVQQGDSGLVGFSFGQFEQSADLKPFGVSSVSPLI